MMQNQRDSFFKPLNKEIEKPLKSNNARQQLYNNENEMQHEEQDVSDEKLTFLHVKLHQEADKIRKWKNQTEFDMKQKDQKLQESTHTIESLRKSILDLQLQNETLGLTLQEEVNNQQEIVQSVTATRNLCAVLKDHMARTDAKLTDCEAEKTELRYLEKEHKKQFQSLSNKFQEFEQSRIEEHDKLESEILALKDENSKMKEDLQQKIMEAESELNTLQTKCDEKDIEIRDIRTEVQKNQEKIHTYEKTIDMLNDNLKAKEEDLLKSREQYEQSTQMLESVQSSRLSVEEKLEESKSEVERLTNKYTALEVDYHNSNKTHADEMSVATSQIEQNKVWLEEKEERIQCLQCQLDKTLSLLEEVKSSKDMLVMEKADLEKRMKDLEMQNAALLAQKEQNNLTLTEMSATICDLQGQLAKTSDDGSALMSSLGELQKQIMEKTTAGENLEQELNTLQKSLQLEQETNKTTQKKLEDTEEQLAKVQEEIKNKSKELKSKQKEVETLTKQNKNLSKSLEKSENSEKQLSEEIAELKSELELQKETNESLLEERQKQNETIQDQLSSKDKTTTDLEAKNKTLKLDLTAKNKQMKELEKEIKSLKSKVTSITKSLDGKEDKVNQLYSDLEKESTERETLHEQLQKTQQLMEKARQEAEDAQKKTDEMKELSDKCVSEKEDMAQQCERMRTEMSNIMQNYKSENDKQVKKKEEEIKALKTELGQAKKNAKKEVSAEIEKLREENDSLRKAISETGQEVETLQKTFGQKENEVIELSKENMKKDEELRDLQQQLEKMFIKSTTNTVVQTSPFPEKTYSASHRATTPKDLPRTPQVSHRSTAESRTPVLKQTPRLPNTPSAELKTPQRSILKNLSTNSACKKRRVMFATKDDDDDSSASSQDTFEVMEQQIENATCRTPLMLKHSPKVMMQEKTKSTPFTHLTRTPRGPAIDHNKKKDKKLYKENAKSGYHRSEEMEALIPEETSKSKEKPSSIRKAPKKEGGKFFKASPRSKMAKLREKEDTAWFENDDIFGFANED